MNSNSIRTRQKTGRFLIAGCLALHVWALASGCGPEKQTVTPNPTPTAVPHGVSQEEYMKKMREVGGGGGGGGAPTPGAPGGPGAPGTTGTPSGR